MHIVIYASGIPFNGNTVHERSLGGSESAAYYVAKELAARGNEVVLFTEDEQGGEWDGVKYVFAGEKSDQNPLGANWHFYCENTPHDINIVQRHPLGFIKPLRSNVNLFWAHDIALKRNADPILASLWQIDAFMPVSNWFKDQIADAWGVNPEVIKPITNGVDYEAFDKFGLKDNAQAEHINVRGTVIDAKPVTLMYSSRPERGLEHLVREGGIMERLATLAPHIELKVCGYEHPVAQLEGFYKHLRERIDLLPNCEHIGALTKDELYQFMCEEADVWCYPTEFEEVSCITAMEAMAAGLTIMTTDVAALKETIGGYQNLIMFDAKEGVPEDKFVERLASFNNKFRRRTHRPYTWESATDRICDVIDDCYDTRRDPDAIARHYLHNSDIVALSCLDGRPSEVDDELKLYDFRHSQEAYADHYSEGTEEMYDGPDFHYEEGFENHPRFQAVAHRLVALELKDGATVIDYGCAHGHFTNNLAKMFPKMNFVGVDVSPKAIAVANAKATEWVLDNVTYIEDDWLSAEKRPRIETTCDALIIGEILEHVPDLEEFLCMCENVVGKDVPCIATTPFGPWEANSYEKEFPTRYHLHHLEREDLRDLFKELDGFEILCMPAGTNTIGEALGWYICTFNLDNTKIRSINYARKYERTVPRQTVSFCVIAKDAANDLPRLLKSVSPYVDEIIVGVDKKTTDDTFAVVSNHSAYLAKHRSPACTVTAFNIDSPLEIGFDAARNAVIERATMQWIMWADADEEFVGGERMRKFLRNNQWRGYGIAQHHFSTEPLGVLSTDFPVRLFRNNENVKFLGVVHEHPECAHLKNEGVGHAFVLNELHFNHYGYTTEEIRRNRFRRNIGLMARDRQENPDRILGMYLWIRDLALMCRFELEQNGRMITPQMREQAESGLRLWEEVLDKYGTHKQTQRMVKDHLEFYDTLVNVVDRGFTYRMKLSSGAGPQAPELSQVPELKARFANRRHLDKFLSVVIDNEVKRYEEKYH